MMKNYLYFVVLSLLLISFRPIHAQTASLQTDCLVTFPTTSTCQDIQVMNGYTYDLVYLGYWTGNGHYQINKRDSSGTVLTSQDHENVSSMLCYDNKVLVYMSDNIMGNNVTGNYPVRLYDQNLSVLKDTVWSPPWISFTFIYTKFYFDNIFLWKISSGDNSDNIGTVKLEKFGPNSLMSVGSITLDSVTCVDMNTGLDYTFFIKYGDLYYLNVFKQDAFSTLISQKLKINNNLQIVASDPPVIGDHYRDFFPYNGSLYYWSDDDTVVAKLIKKDASNFSTSWQTPLPYSGASRAPTIFPFGNIFLWAAGDGKVHKINPTNGAVLSTVAVTYISSEDNKYHHFGKIGCSPEYPFMIIGPTYTNPTEPFKFYLLDPVTLDTLLTQVILGIGDDYMVKELDGKFYIIGNKIVALSVLTTSPVWPSLQISMGSPTQVVTNGATTISLSTPVPPEISFNQNHDIFWIKNLSSSPKQVICKKIVLEEVAGTSNSFYWGALCSSGTSTSSSPINIAPADSFGGFTSYYHSNGLVGFTKIRYVFFDQADVNDSVYFDVTYDLTVGIDQTSAPQIRIFPNPSSDYLYLEGLVKPQLELFDLLGAPCLNSTSLKVDVSSLSPGIYFYRLYDDKIKVTSGKLVKR